MDAAGLAAGTIETRYVNVRSVFSAALKDKVIGSDPTDSVRLPRGRRPEAAMSIPTPEEVGQFLAVSDGRFQAFIALCAFAGLRLGEAAEVQLGDIDFPPEVADRRAPGAARQWRDRRRTRAEVRFRAPRLPR
jgi:integrase